MSGPGKVNAFLRGPATVHVKLSNFDVDKADLKLEHRSWLQANAVNLLKAGGSAFVIGLASRTGSDKHNLLLSRRRVDSTIALLRQQSSANFKVAFDVAIGERAAQYAGVKDGVEDEEWRAVILAVWNKPDPPPPPPPPPPVRRVDADIPKVDYKEFYKHYNSWIGFGGKSGGQLLIGGVESTTAFMINLGDGETFELQIVSSRWGLGLGGSGGFVAVLAFGFREPYELHRKSLSDWGVNVAFTQKLISKSAMQSLVHMKRFVDSYKTVKSAFNMSRLEQIRNVLHTLMAGYDAFQRKGVVVIDLPVLGGGLELSAFLTRGTMYVSNSSDMDL